MRHDFARPSAIAVIAASTTGALALRPQLPGSDSADHTGCTPAHSGTGIERHEPVRFVAAA
jgi:hypothetical protein